MINNIKKHRTEIMGFAALWILILHVWYPCFYASSSAIAFTEDFVVGAGYLGVDIFLFLSGLGLFNSMRNNDIKNFYIHRIKRLLFPVLIISIVFATVNKWNVTTYVFNVFGINFFRISIYCFLWFIIAIELIYLFFPLYYKVFSIQKNKIIFTIIEVIAYVFLLVLFQSYIRKDLFVFLNRIPIFLLGVLFAYIDLEKHKIINNKILFLFFIVIFVFGCYELYLCNKYSHFILVPYSGYLIPAICVSIPLIVFLSCFFEKISILRLIFRTFGKMSLELYCVQEIINEYLRPILSFAIRDIFLQNIITFAVIIIAAYCLYYVCKFLSNSIFK